MASAAFVRRGSLFTVDNFQAEEMANDDRTTTGESKPAPHGDANSEGGGIFAVGTVAAIGEKPGCVSDSISSRWETPEGQTPISTY